MSRGETVFVGILIIQESLNNTFRKRVQGVTLNFDHAINLI